MAADDGNDAPQAASRAAPPTRATGSPASLMHVASYSLPDTRTPVAKPTARPLSEPVAKPLAKSPAKSLAKPTAKPLPEPIAKSDAPASKKHHETALNVSSAIKSIKIATAVGKPHLPQTAATAKVSAERKPVKKQASAAAPPKDKATN